MILRNSLIQILVEKVPF